MQLSEHDVRLRRPVWIALGELYLDTEPPWEAVAATCAASSFGLDALQRILFDEVHPVLRFNMGAVAGVWQGFDEEWLVDAIVSRRRRPWLRLSWFERRRYPWRELRPLVVAKRRQAPASC